MPRLPAWRWSPGEMVSPTTVAISVAGDGLRLIAMKGSEVNLWQHVPLRPGLLRHGWIADPEEFGVALRGILKDYELAGGRLLWAMPGSMGLARLLSVKLAGASDPNAVVAREAAWALPITPEDHYLYWQPAADGFLDHVFVLAVQKAAVDNILRACDVAGARTWSLDLKPLSLGLAIGAPDAIIADVEANSLDLLIMVQGTPVAMRSLQLGDEPLPAGEVRTRLLEELTMSMQLYNSTNPELPLDQAIPVYLTGDLCDDELASKIAFVTKHPTVEPVVPFACPPGLPAGRYMANLGLLLKRS